MPIRALALAAVALLLAPAARAEPPAGPTSPAPTGETAPAPAGATTVEVQPPPGAPAEADLKLADDLLFCGALAAMVEEQGGKPDPKGEQRQVWHTLGVAYVSGAASLLPVEAELRAHARAAIARRDAWIDGLRDPAAGREEMQAKLAACTAAMNANEARFTALRVARRKAAPTPPPAAGAPALTYAGVRYLHRWSGPAQHEYTPEAEPDLSRWTRMLTFDVHAGVKDADALAALAKGVAANYRRAGQVLKEEAVPGGGERLVTAVLAAPGVRECTFVRVVLRDGRGLVVVASRRFSGERAEADAAAFMSAHAAEEERALLAWDGVPSAAALDALEER